MINPKDVYILCFVQQEAKIDGYNGANVKLFVFGAWVVTRRREAPSWCFTLRDSSAGPSQAAGGTLVAVRGVVKINGNFGSVAVGMRCRRQEAGARECVTTRACVTRRNEPRERELSLELPNT
jgi:hypothetical protein